MREIVDGILTWSWYSEPHGYDFNGHLIRESDGNICIDPVEPSDDDLEAIAREGAAWILLTDRNHSRLHSSARAFLYLGFDTLLVGDGESFLEMPEPGWKG